MYISDFDCRVPHVPPFIIIVVFVRMYLHVASTVASRANNYASPFLFAKRSIYIDIDIIYIDIDIFCLLVGNTFMAPLHSRFSRLMLISSSVHSTLDKYLLNGNSEKAAI